VRRTDQRHAAVFVSYQRDVTGAPIEELVDRPAAGSAGGTMEERGSATAAVTDFARELIEGVEEHRDELDELIEDQAIGWRVERIAPLERAILRVALYEILYRDDVPDEVAIDEAVETAKLYCGTEAPGFVNGILGGILRKVRDG
jgi:transcription antitermination protein NusB